MNKHEEVIICGTCQGTGVAHEPDGSYEISIVICRRCKGSGRLKKTIEIVPFIPEPNKTDCNEQNRMDGKDLESAGRMR